MSVMGCFRRKPCVDLVGNDDGAAFGRRFPSLRHHREATVACSFVCLRRKPQIHIWIGRRRHLDVVSPPWGRCFGATNRVGRLMSGLKCLLGCWSAGWWRWK
ncbi:hypothetical protein VPH35_013580 [Triticum aestivum]